MKALAVIVATFVAFLPKAFAGGGSEDVIAELNGWRLRIGSGSGSEAYIEREANGVRYHGRLEFEQFWDYFLVLKSLPRSPGNKPTKIWIVDENDKQEKPPTYLVVKDALPVMQLVLLTHRAKILSDEPDRLEKELNSHLPLPPHLVPNGNFTFIVKSTKAEQGDGGKPATRPESK